MGMSSPTSGAGRRAQVAIVCALAGTAVVVGCGEAEPVQRSQSGGGAVFASAGCGSCHTLAAAGASGRIGPNLDESGSTVEDAVMVISDGRGGMPSFKGQLRSEEIRSVAEYVARETTR